MATTVEDLMKRTMELPTEQRAQYSIEADYVLIVAVMHCSREPGYWKQRIGS